MANSLVSRIAAGSELFIVFFRELITSSWAVARAAFARDPATRSAIVAVPITLKTDLGIATLANMITLTPGTCSLHVSDDRKWIYVHALDAPDPEGLVSGIVSTFEARIRRVEL
ncbi:Na+/H+ antiporter subunit E [Aureimonas altamirensis]|uniref:Na+/H+ antiporter subunit E n=1 Tax=Aureimonas TaxID=414371 RepID=UPI001781344E|nr:MULTISPECIES: Na+/H+ antiporter subunit E [Aureimonas]MCM2504242.1 Na+/H+ antiporter subunit E [Aureimonas altamirensis]QOG05159.1 Na+/H+ antiporter subunit E [Aureimonas sp. OT7]